MTDYTKSTNFASKDSLLSGNPLKLVKGTELDTEFNNIATSITTKADSTQVATDISDAIDAISGDYPLKDGTGATGTWDIDISGNAATATTATTADTATTATSATSATTADKLSTASGSAPSYACRAWVNFNGTGTVAIRESGNVDYITDNGTGDYTVTFTTAMPDSNYSIFGTANNSTSTATGAGFQGVEQDSTNAPTSSSVRIRTRRSTVNYVDLSLICVSIFR